MDKIKIFVDLDNTLVDTSCKKGKSLKIQDFLIKNKKNINDLPIFKYFDGIDLQLFYIIERPGAKEFLEALKQVPVFEVNIFSMATKKYIEQVLHKLNFTSLVDHFYSTKSDNIPQIKDNAWILVDDNESPTLKYSKLGIFEQLNINPQGNKYHHQFMNKQSELISERHLVWIPPFSVFAGEGPEECNVFPHILKKINEKLLKN